MKGPHRGLDGGQFQHNFKNTYLTDADLKKPSKEVSQQITNHTQRHLDNLVFQKKCAAFGKLRDTDGDPQQMIKYTPKSTLDQQASEKIIKVQAIKLDPLELPRFRHKRIPKGPGSPPPIMMRSPPRKLTVKDQLDWKIPPCISNWKNAKGYTIPLEMRLSADGRTLQHYTVNAKFAQLTDGLYIAERQARKELEERNKIMKSIAYREHQEKEEELRRKAAEARAAKNILLEQSTDIDNRQLTEQEQQKINEREELRYIRKRELEREQRMDAAGIKKSKASRDQERDISEKVALGQAQPNTQELLYDQRLFNQSSGLNAGFADEDEYDVFDKPLFNDRSNVSLYANVKKQDIDDEEPANEKQEKPMRNRPVEFEKAGDIFGMDSFITDTITKKVKKE